MAALPGPDTPAPRTALALECAVGRAHVAVPVDFVDAIIEYEVTGPLPLARAWIGGLGFHEGRMVVSVALSSRTTSSPTQVRMVKGVLLHAPGSEIAWALEIGAVSSFVRVTILERRVSAAAGALPSWITGAKTTEDDRSIAWLDVGAMIADLAGSTLGLEDSDAR